MRSFVAAVVRLGMGYGSYLFYVCIVNNNIILPCYITISIFYYFLAAKGAAQ